MLDGLGIPAARWVFTSHILIKEVKLPTTLPMSRCSKTQLFSVFFEINDTENGLRVHQKKLVRQREPKIQHIP